MTTNRYILKVKRPFIWLRRIRHRCGYGVHSPFAFGFITDVVYEKRSYYCYRTLHEQHHSGMFLSSHHTPERINRLLFRIANYRQPQTVVVAGGTKSAADYIRAARRSAEYLSLDEASQIDLIYIDADSADETERIFRKALPKLTPQSICIVMGIRYSGEMKQLWRRLEDDEQVGITFDLYHIGVIFFDRKKIKQHYIVNF